MDQLKSPPVIVVCVGAIVLKDEQILLVRQAEGHPLEKQWTIPWGFVEPGEAPEKAVIREIQEESGIKSVVQGLLGIQNLPAPWNGWISIVFRCKHISGIPKPDGGRETDRADYFTLEELSQFKDEIEIWCAWLAERVLTGIPKLIPPEPKNPYSPKIAFL